jgi:diguanylate cyclase (GGDEF)-like protein
MESLAERARRDGLTGLYNHQHAQRMLGELCRHGEPFSLIVFDLDELKQVNDGYGHRWGDEVLRAFALALAHATRTGDLAFRTGGDEFMLLLPTAGQAAAQKLVRRIEQECRHVPLLTLLQIGLSHGLAHAPDDANNQPDLLEHADRNLYQHKHQHQRKRERAAAPADAGHRRQRKTTRPPGGLCGAPPGPARPVGRPNHGRKRETTESGITSVEEHCQDPVENHSVWFTNLSYSPSI